jgi:hypothetical protein
MRRRCAAVLAAAAALVAAGGCAMAPGAGRPAPVTLEVLTSRAPDPATALSAAELEPTAPGASPWQVIGTDARFTMRIEALPGGATRTDPAGTRSMEVGPDGSVALRSQADAADGAETAFAPPLMLAPARLRAGEEPAAESRLTTRRAGVGGDDAGSARRTLRIASVDRVRTPLGEFDAIRVDAVLTMKLPFASMTRQSSTWVRAGVGPVAVRSDERILVMGIVPRNTAETRVRLPGGGGAP